MIKNQFRYEIKFILNFREMSHVFWWLNNIGIKKSYPDRKINSLYFDNSNYDCVKDNIAGLSNRHKLRLRWYINDDLTKTEPRFEIKFKDGRVGSKIIYPLNNIRDSLDKKNLMDLSTEVFQKLRNSYPVHNSLNDYLLPTLLTTYNRKYLKYSEDIRITIDNDIKFYDVALQNLKIKSLKPLKYNLFIMEIKFTKNFKNNVSNLLRMLKLTPKRHSKYLTGMSKLGYAVYI